MYRNEIPIESQSGRTSQGICRPDWNLFSSARTSHTERRIPSTDYSYLVIAFFLPHLSATDRHGHACIDDSCSIPLQKEPGPGRRTVDSYRTLKRDPRTCGAYSQENPMEFARSAPRRFERNPTDKHLILFKAYCDEVIMFAHTAYALDPSPFSSKPCALETVFLKSKPIGLIGAPANTS